MIKRLTEFLIIILIIFFIFMIINDIIKKEILYRRTELELIRLENIRKDSEDVLRALKKLTGNFIKNKNGI